MSLVSTPLNILLADDDIDDCQFFKSVLTELQLTTTFTVVNDGEQLMKLLSDETNALPDVLFLDLNMPRKNGFECLAEINLSERLKKIPVVMYSTSLEKEVVNLLYKNGAQYFIRKPSEFPKFKKLVQQTLALIIGGNKLQPAREQFVLTIEEIIKRLNLLNK